MLIVQRLALLARISALLLSSLQLHADQVDILLLLGQFLGERAPFADDLV